MRTIKTNKGDHMESIQILHESGNRMATIRVTEDEWRSINTVDYLQVDAYGNLTSDFAVHGSLFEYHAKQILASWKRGERL